MNDQSDNGSNIDRENGGLSSREEFDLELNQIFSYKMKLIQSEMVNKRSCNSAINN